MDLAHEALIGGWPWLREWIEERRATEITRRRLEESADARERLRKEDPDGGLLDAAELAEAEKFVASPDAAELGVSPRVTALVADSREAIEATGRKRNGQRLGCEAAANDLRKRNQGLGDCAGSRTGGGGCSSCVFLQLAAGSEERPNGADHGAGKC